MNETDELIYEIVSQLSDDEKMRLLEEAKMMLEQDKCLQEYYANEEIYRRSYEFETQTGRK